MTSAGIRGSVIKWGLITRHLNSDSKKALLKKQMQYFQIIPASSWFLSIDQGLKVIQNGSDIDLVIKDKLITVSELLKIKNELNDLLLPYKIDLSQMQKIENNDLLDHIKRVGKIFYKIDSKHMLENTEIF